MSSGHSAWSRSLGASGRSGSISFEVTRPAGKVLGPRWGHLDHVNCERYRARVLMSNCAGSGRPANDTAPREF